MSKEDILNKIDRLGDLFVDMMTDQELFQLSDEKKDETNSLMTEIIDYLIWFPGRLFFDENKSRQKRNKVVIDFLWITLEPNDIFDELLSGGYTGLLSNMLDDFSKRVKMLKPTFISVNPESNEFSNYFDEAMKAWLYGLPNASLIICFSLLENLLKDKLCQKDCTYVYELKDPSNPKGVKQVSYDRIIMSSLNEGIINKNEKNILFQIRKLRNNSIHELNSVTDSEVYDAIIQTKDIVERLLKKN